jgi:hypothetical protein
VEIGKHIVAAKAGFEVLNKDYGGFSFWNGPRYFFANEAIHNGDGLHFAWPVTIGNVDMVKLNVFIA